MRSTGKVRRQIPATSRPPEPATIIPQAGTKAQKQAGPAKGAKDCRKKCPNAPPPRTQSFIHSPGPTSITHLSAVSPIRRQFTHHFLTPLSTNRSSIVHPAPPDRARGILTHHPPRTASGRPATPEAARDWVVPGDNSKDHQAPTRHHIAGTKPFVYNQGCKHFCACKTAVMPADSRSKPASPELIFSFTTRPGMQEIPRRRRSR